MANETNATVDAPVKNDAPAAPAKKNKQPIKVDRLAERFGADLPKGPNASAIKTLWVVKGEKGIYAYKSNLKPTGEMPVLAEGEVAANYVQNGMLTPATFVRLTALEDALKAQF